MQKADDLIRSMKKHTDALLASDEQLQQFLTWVSQKSRSVSTPYSAVAVRTFYLRLFASSRSVNNYGLDIVYTRDDRLYLDHSLACALSCAREVDFAVDSSLAIDHALALVIALDYALALDCALKPELKRSLQQLKNQLPDLDRNEEEFQQWWETKGQAWIEQLRAVTIEHCNIGHDWQFSEQENELLEQYFAANLLLVECLNTASHMTRAVRQEIEETLLLPIAEIAERSRCQER